VRPRRAPRRTRCGARLLSACQPGPQDVSTVAGRCSSTRLALPVRRSASQQRGLHGLRARLPARRARRRPALPGARAEGARAAGGRELAPPAAHAAVALRGHGAAEHRRGGHAAAAAAGRLCEGPRACPRPGQGAPLAAGVGNGCIGVIEAACGHGTGAREGKPAPLACHGPAVSLLQHGARTAI